MSAVPQPKPKTEPRTAADGFKAYRRGTHRTVDPTATLARVRPHLQGMGITRIANVTGLDRLGIPVVMVCRPNSRSLAVSQGKGLTLDAAKASGVMEAIELYHAERIELPLKLASGRDLARTHRLVDLDALPRVPHSRFVPDLPMLWVSGRNLLDDREVWLPFESVHCNAVLPLPPGSGSFPADSNGLASGNHLLEALCHGICEVIERDATSLWHQLDQAHRQRTRIDLATINDPSCQALLAQLEHAGLSVGVWEATTDIGVASFQCVIVDRHRESAHAGIGAGCHPTRTIALLRALTEAAQVRLTYITGARDDLLEHEFTRATLRRRHRMLRRQMADATMRDFRASPNQEFPTFEQDLDWLLERLSAAGITEVVAVDLTRPEIGLPVVKVVIAGLEGSDHHDYVPGRRALAARGRQS
jgi:YcaO-like protein with predicted kinase domain